jgi:ATP phosphoribosyltransferase regulatory subunit
MRVEPRTPSTALAAIRAPLAQAGAEPREAPLLQPLGLLLDLAGETLRSRLFVVQAEGGAEECLRPDFTVAIARAHLAGDSVEGRYLYEGPAFRASPGTDQPEEFQQLGVELFSPPGGPAVAADVEAVALAWRTAEAGGREDLSLRLGDVGLYSAFIDALGLPEALARRLKRVVNRPRLLQAELARVGEVPKDDGGRLPRMLAGLGEAQAAGVLEDVWALAGVEPVGGRSASEIAQRLVRRAEAARAPALTGPQARAIAAFMAIDDAPGAALKAIRGLAGGGCGTFETAMDEWDARLTVLSQAIPGAEMRFAPALGHAFNYYDGLTFEVRSAALGAERPVAAGGRYDGLLVRLGGQPGRAVGCMVRPWRAFSGGEA